MVSDGTDRYYGSGDLLDPYLAAAIEDAQRTSSLRSIPLAWVTMVIATGGHIGVSFTSRRLRRRSVCRCENNRSIFCTSNVCNTCPLYEGSLRCGGCKP